MNYSKFHYFQQVESTMDIARDMAEKGCPDFTVIIAESQTKGRGRLQREWFSDKGGIYFTVVLRPEIPAHLASRINFAVSLVLVKTLTEMFDIDAKVKWPNDILVDERKLCGMLSEIHVQDEDKSISYINIGIGINANNLCDTNVPGSVSLKYLIGKEVVRKDIIEIFLNNLQGYMQSGLFENTLAEWKEYTITLNREVRIVTTKETVRGIAKDIDQDGSLILTLADGTTKNIIYGDCFLTS